MRCSYTFIVAALLIVLATPLVLRQMPVDVVSAQKNALNNHRLSSQLLGQQLQASTLLVKALGGGW